MPDSSPGSAGSPREITVLFVSPAAYFIGGAEHSLMDLITNPAIRAVLAAPGTGAVTEAAADLGIPVRSFSYGAIAHIRRPFKMRAVLTAMRDSVRLARHLSGMARDEGAQIIHSNGLKVHVIACLSRLFGGPPVFVHLRDIPVNRAERLVWGLFRLLPSRVILVSRPCWPWPTMPPHVRVIHNGLALPPPPLPEKRISLPLTVGYVGRISPFKGLKLLVGWIARCRADGLDVRLLVRGSAQPGDTAYMASVHDVVAALHLQSVCRFEGERRGLQAVYENVDVVAVPSHVPDPLPRVVMEAMSLGLPVIGFPAGGIPEMIQHGKTGYLASTADEFCAAVGELTRTPGRFEDIRSAAYAWVRKNMSLEVLHRNITDEYRRVLSNRRNTAGEATSAVPMTGDAGMTQRAERAELLRRVGWMWQWLWLALFVAPGVGAAAEVATPLPGSPERAHILDALRADVAGELPRPVVFRVQRLAVTQGWAFLAATPQQPDGRPYDYRGTRYQAFIDDGVFDDNLFALLQQRAGRWQVRVRVIGATDVPYTGWSKEYGAPAALFR